MENLTKEQLELLKKPLPDEAVSQHPTKKYLSSIKAIYVTERFNDVFGVGVWRIETGFIEKVDKMVVIKVVFTVSKYDIHIENYWGNDNADLWDAYKWAVTDAITKIGSFLWIWADVFKWKQKWSWKTEVTKTDEDKKEWLNAEHLLLIAQKRGDYTRDTIVKKARAVYKISKAMATKLEELYD